MFQLQALVPGKAVSPFLLTWCRNAPRWPLPVPSSGPARRRPSRSQATDRWKIGGEPSADIASQLAQAHNCIKVQSVGNIFIHC